MWPPCRLPTSTCGTSASSGRTAQCTKASCGDRAATARPDRVQPVSHPATVRRGTGGPRLAPGPLAGRSRSSGGVVCGAGFGPRPGMRRAGRAGIDAFRCGASRSFDVAAVVYGRSPRLPGIDDAVSRTRRRTVRRHPQSQPAPPSRRDGPASPHPDADHRPHPADAVAGVRATDDRRGGDAARGGQPAHRTRMAPRGRRDRRGAQRRGQPALAAGTRRRRFGVVRPFHPGEGASPRDRGRTSGESSPGVGRSALRPGVLCRPHCSAARRRSPLRRAPGSTRAGPAGRRISGRAGHANLGRTLRSGDRRGDVLRHPGGGVRLRRHSGNRGTTRGPTGAARRCQCDGRGGPSRGGASTGRRAPTRDRPLLGVSDGDRIPDHLPRHDRTRQRRSP